MFKHTVVQTLRFVQIHGLISSKHTDIVRNIDGSVVDSMLVCNKMEDTVFG